MQSLPATTLRIYDTTGQGIATVHLMRNANPKKVAGDCIIVVDPEQEPSTRPEVRWLLKRRFELVGEHRFRLDGEGVLTIESGGFVLKLHPQNEEDLLHTAPSGPQVSARWET